MPDIDQLDDSNLIKMIYIGDSGSGKTGSLASLAAAGYNLRVLDVDKGISILKDYATNPASMYLQPKPGLWTAEQAKGIARRINYIPVSETFTNTGGHVIAKGDSYQKMLGYLTEWKYGETNFGKLETWTEREVLVIDSFSRVCDARMYMELNMNARAVSGRQQSDYWKVQDAIERFLELLVSYDPLTKKGMPCHVILIGHVDYVEKDDGTTRGMPQSMGKALGPKIAQHFNHALLAKTSGQGTLARRKILTQTTGTIDLKNAAPLRVKPEYDLETGLAEYFQAVLGKGPLAPGATP